MQQLSLKRREERRLRAGHLWIFSNEVDVACTPLTGFAPGESATVMDAGGRPLGTAYVNPASLICARLFSRTPDTPLDAALLRERLTQALSLRQRLFDAPFYRLCYGEGDALPGLVVDRYGEHLAVQISTAGMEAHKAELLDVLIDLLRPASILLRNDMAARDLERLPRVVEAPLGTPPQTLSVPENGAIFSVPFLEGQKTGWFYDQRANRADAARYAKGQTVLDAFCYAGGFGVTAAVAGAASVCFMDASRTALEAATANLAANTPRCPGEAIQGDAPGELAALRDAGRRFGLVCIDPPAFIKRRKDAAQGLAAYRKVNSLAMDLVEDGGVLMSCSCSHHLDAAELRHIISQAAAKRHLHCQILHQGTQGPDHPIHAAMPETAYLKCVTARFLR